MIPVCGFFFWAKFPFECCGGTEDGEAGATVDEPNNSFIMACLVASNEGSTRGGTGGTRVSSCFGGSDCSVDAGVGGVARAGAGGGSTGNGGTACVPSVDTGADLAPTAASFIAFCAASNISSGIYIISV